MCFDFDAQPPELPMNGDLLAGVNAPRSAVASTQDLVLTSQDGTRFAAFVARPETPNGAGIVILPDVRGLFQFYKDLASRFAAAGVEAIAIDYFGRTAGLTPRDEQFEFWPHVQQTRAEQVAQDVAAAVAYLRQLPGAAPRAIFTVGFCFGGANSFLQAANRHGLSGVIGFYGPPVGEMRMGGPAPVERVREFECPVLGLFGGADQAIPAEAIQRFDAALAEAGVEHELITYPGAPHSFFDRKYEEFQAESADAWQRMLAFIGAHTPQTR